ncbi:MAG: trypsin-like peptidase domain-containing protein [Candidatus Cohnella colombiensis]|uniref:Trypsin-like peptidase domain-containing protein n=1 Tax=Candidatus Cohnella colombiensis TaxID=3121368 RepID=A0AA95EXD0_9BACL|nr:MAG: trypsin-like peptidase domain-containing protein [Cohnella sp.]
MDENNKQPEDQVPSSNEQDNREDPYASVRRESEPYTFGPFGPSPTPSPSESPLITEYKPSIEQAPNEVMIAASNTREYRPFTVSGGVARSDWGGKPPRKTSFLAIFASFMIGVLVVGGLMFASDQGNWFTKATATSGAVSSQEPEVKAVNSTVNDATDVVRPNNIAQIFEQSSPAVVRIETYAKARSSSSSMWQDDFFRQFFGEQYDNRSNNGSEDQRGALQQSGMGSGFIFDSTGYILTNQHVIGDADQIKVIVDGYEEPFVAELLGSSYDLDLAVLKIKGNEFPTLKLGDASSLNMGDWVVAIGNPYGFDHTVTVGVLSSNEREISISDSNGTRNYKHLLQTDASINPGNSGGPLLNLKGEVIGINTAVSSEAQGIGFAIPTTTITEVLDNLKNNTKIPQAPVPFIGANLMDVTVDIAQRLGIDENTKGSFVKDVLFNSPAYKADLRQYDVILGIEDKKYKTKEDLIAEIQKKSVGDKVNLDILRGDKNLQITVIIGDRNEFEAK